MLSWTRPAEQTFYQLCLWHSFLSLPVHPPPRRPREQSGQHPVWAPSASRTWVSTALPLRPGWGAGGKSPEPEPQMWVKVLSGPYKPCWVPQGQSVLPSPEPGPHQGPEVCPPVGAAPAPVPLRSQTSRPPSPWLWALPHVHSVRSSPRCLCGFTEPCCHAHPHPWLSDPPGTGSPHLVTDLLSDLSMSLPLFGLPSPCLYGAGVRIGSGV